jgi:hypothetical protein
MFLSLLPFSQLPRVAQRHNNTLPPAMNSQPCIRTQFNPICSSFARYRLWCWALTEVCIVVKVNATVRPSFTITAPPFRAWHSTNLPRGLFTCISFLSIHATVVTLNSALHLPQLPLPSFIDRNQPR